MKFAYAFPGRMVPPVRALMTAKALSALAVAAELAGFAAVDLDDHPAAPEAWRRDPSGHDGIEPFSALAAVAAATSEIRLLVNLCVVPYRNPFLIAKSAATLDLLSEGRLVLGVGTGYLEGEFEALGVDFSRRNELFDEAITVMKLAWTGEPVTYEGSGFRAREITCQPTPVQHPHPPLWIGGNSTLTLRRVADYGAAWMIHPPVSSSTISRHTPRLESLDAVRARLNLMRSYADDAGRTEAIDVLYMLRGRTDGSAADVVDTLRELEVMGITWVSVVGAGSTIPAALDAIKRYRDEVIGPYEECLR